MAKAVSYSDLLDGIDEVLQGGAPLSKEISRMVIESFQRNTDSPLSRRETEVLEKLAQGKSYSQIADELFVHRETIKMRMACAAGVRRPDSRSSQASLGVDRLANPTGVKPV